MNLLKREPKQKEPQPMDKRLNAVLKNVEDAANNFKPGGNEALVPTVSIAEVPLHRLAENNPNNHGVPRVGVEAAGKMQLLSNTAAADIRKLGDLALRSAEEVRDRCYQMAEDVEANGLSIATSLKGLAHLLADVGMSNRETYERLLRGDTIPALAEHVSKQTEKIEPGHIDEAPEHGTDGTE